MVILFISDMSRAMIALFIVAFFFMFVSFTTGIVGCWRTSPSNIQASAVLMLLACMYLPKKIRIVVFIKIALLKNVLFGHRIII